MPDQLVLVTGGSGFIGAHCIKRLHEDGHRVRTTVRSLSREGEVRDMVGDGPLEVVAADLTADEGWAEAVAGCDSVLHVASPFPRERPHRRAHAIAVLVQPLDAVGADEAGAAGDENELVGHGRQRNGRYAGAGSGRGAPTFATSRPVPKWAFCGMLVVKKTGSRPYCANEPDSARK